VAAGAALERACEVAGISVRTVQRWRTTPEDRRGAPTKPPANKLTDEENRQLMQIMNSPENCDLSPNQLVPKLADQGQYVASESTMYRRLREAAQLGHRSRAKVPTKRRRPEHEATGPNQVWSWDITYLRAPVRGTFFYLYLVVDIFSRRIMGWQVHEMESMDLAAQFIRETCRREGVDPAGLVLHSDNGGPMRGATMLTTLQSLGIVPSFSRPSVSDDNPFSEALFRTLKYRPSFPEGAFASKTDAQTWVERFVRWYNSAHRHSSIRFVTPDERHFGRDVALLKGRDAVYSAARAAIPARWSAQTRNWTRPECVRLNPRVAEMRAAA
jgi:transposase InsO family protein